MAKIRKLSATSTRNVLFDVGKVIERRQKIKGEAFDAAVLKMEADIRAQIDTQHPPASSPGDPPHRRSGHLHDNFFVGRDGYEVVVKVPQYGIYLDGGTGRMAARPFIRRNLHERGGGKFWAQWINNNMREQLGEPIVVYKKPKKKKK